MNALTSGNTLQRLRLISGLVLFTFAALHFSNHALGIWSLEAMETGQQWRTALTRSLPGKLVIMTALVVHVALGLFKLVNRESWRMPFWEAAQIGIGLAIPLLLIPHIIFTGVAHNLYGYEDRYLNALNNMWPGVAWKQTALLLLVWTHGCVGLHYWLRLSPAYRRIAPFLLIVAAMVPTLALAGFVSAAREAKAYIEENPEAAALFDDDALEFLFALLNHSETATYVVWGSIAAVLALRAIRRTIASGKISIAYAAGPSVRTMPGPTLLEISRLNAVPHASVCGGRARCSTCRVRIAAGAGQLPPPGDAEAATLKRIGADPDVRLACQIRPHHNLRVTRMVKPDVKTGPRHVAADPETAGVERTMAVMFFDIRGFTSFSDERLPYDTVFLLNRLFAEIGEAIQQSGGWIDKYLGDGLMAIFGRSATPAQGCRQGLDAIRRIDAALARVNAELKQEIDEPLRVGMGLHVGPLVLGSIGHQDSAALTVIGRTVNVASRLEGLTKDHGVQVIISLEVLETAGVDTTPFTIETVQVRGSSEPIRIALVERGSDLDEILSALSDDDADARPAESAAVTS